MNNYIFILLSLSIVVNVGLWTCTTRQKEMLSAQEKIYFNAQQEFDVKKNALEQTVILQKAVITEHSSKIDNLLRENTKLKYKIDAQIKSYQTLEIVNKELTANQKVVTIRDTIYYAVGTRFDHTEECFSLQSQLTATGLLIESFKAETNAVVSIDKKYNVSLVLSNPCIAVNNMASIIQKDKKKWYENKFLIFSLGFITGFGATATAVYLIR